jgi:hypothetical protein
MIATARVVGPFCCLETLVGVGRFVVFLVKKSYRDWHWHWY